VIASLTNGGYLKKGTVLKINEAMPEGFTRYILYLNLKGNRTSPHKTEHDDQVVPYWLHPVDSTKQIGK
jgi:hypothetical protein